MSRPAKAATFTALLIAAAGAPGVANAQWRGGAVSVIPLGVPLDEVPVGSWAEYRWKHGGWSSGKTFRLALVGREEGSHVIEWRTQTWWGEKLLTRNVLTSDPTQEAGIEKVVIQTGDSDPMELPVGGDAPGPAVGGPGGVRWIKPVPRTMVGTETVKVAAGTFQTEHHRTEGHAGQTVDYWIAKGPGPYGLVKMQTDHGGPHSDGSLTMTLELVARGKSAKAELIKSARPFDAEAMRRRWFGPRRGPGR